jgi:hypothetical protein
VTADRGGKREFDEPIPLPNGRSLVTLKDAGTYITKLPKSDHATPERQAAMESLILVAEQGGPTMLARDRHHEGYEPSRRTGVQPLAQRHALGAPEADARSMISAIVDVRF